jgi:hypothetical protein
LRSAGSVISACSTCSVRQVSSAASRLEGAFPPDGDLSSDLSLRNRQQELNFARAI